MGYTEKTWSVGELVTAANLNSTIRDNFKTAVPHLIVRKTADESVTSSTTLQNDDALFFSVAANEIWWVRLSLRVVENGTALFKSAYTFPAGGTLDITSFSLNSAGTAAYFNWNTSGTAPASQLGSTPSANVLIHEGYYINGGTAGTLQLQWAQGVSNGTATTVLAQSTLWGAKLA